jgi:hypothetical protein
MPKPHLTAEEAAAIVTLARRTRARGGHLMDCEEALLLVADQRDEAVSQLAFYRAVSPPSASESPKDEKAQP